MFVKTGYIQNNHGMAMTWHSTAFSSHSVSADLFTSLKIIRNAIQNITKHIGLLTEPVRNLCVEPFLQDERQSKLRIKNLRVSTIESLQRQ